MTYIHNIARSLMLLLLVASASMTSLAQMPVRFMLSAGSIGRNALRTGIETNTAALLTELNRAASDNDENLNLEGFQITEDAARNLRNMWALKRMTVLGQENSGKIFVEKPCLKIPGGYQVSPLEVSFFDTEDGRTEESAIAVNFDASGVITDVSFTLSTEQYKQLLGAGLKDVRDEEVRTLISYWMGQLKNAYEMRDIDFFKTVLSDDAVIITGTRKMNRRSSEVSLKLDDSTYQYYKQTKEEYINRLQNTIFKIYDTISVGFSDQRIKQSSSKPRYYIVDVTQLWDAAHSTSGRHYSDEGRLFVLWDMADKEHPVMLARVWQAKDDPKRWDFIDFSGLE